MPTPSRRSCRCRSTRAASCRGTSRGHRVSETSSRSRECGLGNREKLRVAVGMRRSLLRLPIPPQAVVLSRELMAHRRGTRPVSVHTELVRKRAGALAGPTESGHRVAPHRRLAQSIELVDQRGIFFGDLFPSATRAADTAIGNGRGIEFLLATGDARTRHACGFLHARDAPRPRAWA